jgi:hypothetical protein
MGVDMKLKLSFLLASLLLLASSWSGTADAQSRRLIFEETVIEGEVQKPEITLVITRQNLNTDYNLDLRKSFIPEIVKSVEKAPF